MKIFRLFQSNRTNNDFLYRTWILTCNRTYLCHKRHIYKASHPCAIVDGTAGQKNAESLELRIVQLITQYLILQPQIIYNIRHWYCSQLCLLRYGGDVWEVAVNEIVTKKLNYLRFTFPFRTHINHLFKYFKIILRLSFTHKNVISQSSGEYLLKRNNYFPGHWTLA